MKSIYLALGFLVLTGCTSLHQHVLRDIPNGQTEDEVRASLGEPSEFRPSQLNEKETIWRYYSRQDVCEIKFGEDERVNNKACETLPHESVIASFARGFSNGYQKTMQNQAHCSSMTTGAFTSTDCR